ncbi:unnamed protein product, partial [Ectocarpus sp. 12 AP-2014]
LRIGTLNVNGVRSKKTELRHLLEKKNLDCIALQETLLSATDWALNIPGYRTFTVYGEQKESTRGVAVLLRNAMGAQTVGKSSPWHTFVRCYGLDTPVIIGSAYVPSGKRLGKEPLRIIRNQIRELRGKYPQDSVLLMGDFNRTGAGVERWLNRLEDPVTVVKPKGKDADLGTRDHGSKRTIDHIVTIMAHPADRVRRSRINRRVDISDHYPVTSVRKIECSELPMPGTHWYKKGGTRGEANHHSMIHANYWEPLLDLIKEAASKMVDTIFQVASDHGVTKEPRGNTKPSLKAPIARAIDDRGRLHRKAKKVRGSASRRKAAWEAYEVAKEKASRLIRADRRRTWTKALETASRQMRTDPKAFWHFTSGVAGWKRKDSTGGLQPVKHPDTGVLLTGAADISAAWKTHYERLAADVTGNSRQPDKWASWTAAPKRRHLEVLDTKISNQEMMEALTRLKRHKAPGRDGIPADFLKLVAGETSSESPMGRALLEMLNLMWEHQIIPEEWQDSTVVSIPKKGDVTDMNNHRGISLMSTVLKVLVMIVSARLNAGFEENHLFSCAQAGFRRREECVTQAACLLEIAQRRKFKRKPTYLMFVDLKKAYDTVPQEALLAKLDFYGVRGNMLAFIRALYAKSTIAVRTGDLMSDLFGLKRGVRQGCPLSPVLFNIFINDILDGTESLGVPASGNNIEGASRVSGLLFADDLVAIAPTRAKLAELGNRLTVWLQANEMSAGIHKCGVMAVGVPTRRLEREPHRWRLAGAQLPIVRKYAYLGLNFNKWLNVRTMMGDKLTAGRNLVSRMAPFLRSQHMPIPMKVAVVRGVILPKLLFGAEVYGMRKEITHAMQVQMNRAFRLVVGLREKGTVSNVALWRELAIPPICASAAARRARALQKAGSMRTTIATVVNSPFRSRRWTWSTGTQRWMNRYVHRLAAALPADQRTTSHKRAGQWYIKAQFERAKMSVAAAAEYPGLAHGIAILVQCRLGGFWGAGRLSRRGLVHPKWKRMCPCCKKRVPEDLAHVLLDCPRWKDGRDSLLRDLI